MFQFICFQWLQQQPANDQTKTMLKTTIKKALTLKSFDYAHLVLWETRRHAVRTVNSVWKGKTVFKKWFFFFCFWVLFLKRYIQWCIGWNAKHIAFAIQWRIISVHFVDLTLIKTLQNILILLFWLIFWFIVCNWHWYKINCSKSTEKFHFVKTSENIIFLSKKKYIYYCFQKSCKNYPQLPTCSCSIR